MTAGRLAERAPSAAETVAVPRVRPATPRDLDAVVAIIRCVESIGSPLLEPARYAYVSSAYVRPDVRRRGVLRSLLTEVERWCRPRGLEQMRLHNVAGS